MATIPAIPWSEGDFLAKAKELHRRLRSWHIESFLFPVHTVSEAESRGVVRRTFRETLGDANDWGPRPDRSLTLFPNKGGRKDAAGFVGVAYQDPDDDTDRHLTQWLMADFMRHLQDAGTAPAADYLRATFEHILDLPAWAVCDPPESMRGDDWLEKRWTYMVIGKPVPGEHIDALVDAAERLLHGATAHAARSRKGKAQTNDSRATEPAAGATRPTTPPPDFSEWGLGMDGERWWVFHRIEREWHLRGELKLSPGREQLLMRLMLDSDGRLTRAAVFTAEAAPGRPPGENLSDGISQAISRITTKLFKVMAYTYQGPAIRRPKPFEWDDADRTACYQAKVYLGTAGWTDGNVAGATPRLRFAPTTTPSHNG